MRVGIKEVLTIAPAYGVVVAVLYLKGFWDAFDVNALQFVSLTELVGIAIFPMVAFLLMTPVAWVIGATLGKWLRSLHKTAGAGASESSLEQLPPNVRNGRRLAVCSALALPVIYLLVPSPTKWGVIALLASSVAAPLINNTDLKRLVPGEGARALVLLLVVATPILVYFRGAVDAKRAVDPARARIVDVTRSTTPPQLQRAFYLGLLGSTHFLWDADRNAVLLLPEAESRVMVLVPGASPNPIIAIPWVE